MKYSQGNLATMNRPRFPLLPFNHPWRVGTPAAPHPPPSDSFLPPQTTPPPPPPLAPPPSSLSAALAPTTNATIVMKAKALAIEATIASLQREASGEEVRKLVALPKGKKKFLLCSGAKCTSPLCGHPPPASPEVNEQRVRVTQIILQKSERDGYKISPKYAESMLQKADFKLVAAIKAVKSDIDQRESAFRASGRCYYGGYESLAPRSRDEAILFMEQEDALILDFVKNGKKSIYGTKMYNKLGGPRDKEAAYNLHMAEGLARDERARFFTDRVTEGITGDALEEVMEDFDRSGLAATQSRTAKWYAHEYRAEIAAGVRNPYLPEEGEDEDFDRFVRLAEKVKSSRSATAGATQQEASDEHEEIAKGTAAQLYGLLFEELKAMTTIEKSLVNGAIIAHNSTQPVEDHIPDNLIKLINVNRTDAEVPKMSEKARGKQRADKVYAPEDDQSVDYNGVRLIAIALMADTNGQNLLTAEMRDCVCIEIEQENLRRENLLLWKRKKHILGAELTRYMTREEAHETHEELEDVMQVVQNRVDEEYENGDYYPEENIKVSEEQLRARKIATPKKVSEVLLKKTTQNMIANESHHVTQHPEQKPEKSEPKHAATEAEEDSDSDESIDIDEIFRIDADRNQKMIANMVMNSGEQDMNVMFNNLIAKITQEQNIDGQINTWRENHDLEPEPFAEKDAIGVEHTTAGPSTQAEEYEVKQSVADPSMKKKHVGAKPSVADPSTQEKENIGVKPSVAGPTTQQHNAEGEQVHSKSKNNKKKKKKKSNKNMQAQSYAPEEEVASHDDTTPVASTSFNTPDITFSTPQESAETSYLTNPLADNPTQSSIPNAEDEAPAHTCTCAAPRSAVPLRNPVDSLFQNMDDMDAFQSDLDWVVNTIGEPETLTGARPPPTH